jgi:hypothetical protein
MQPQPGDMIGFQTPDKFGAVIRYGQRHFQKLPKWYVNHIAVVVSVDPTVIVQAVKRVDMVPLSSYPDSVNKWIIPFPGDDSQRSYVVKFAMKQIGRKYGILSVISRAINMLTPRIIQINAEKAGDMDCSCLGARAWEHGGVDLPYPDPWQIVPGQLASDYGLEPIK